jgi:hypothetical protein
MTLAALIFDVDGLGCLVTVNDYTRGQDFEGALAVLDGFGEHARPARVLGGTRTRIAGARWPDEVVVDVALLRTLV